MLINKTHLTLTIIATLTSLHLHAAGFQLNSQSATGLGRAFSGDAVIADNASVMAKNPAAMTLFTTPALSLGLIAINSDINIQNTSITTPTPAGIMSFPVENASIGDVSYVPNIYYIHPVNENIALGASLYSNFGTLTKFPNNYGGNLPGTLKNSADIYGGTTEVKSINLGLSAAYRFNTQFSIGAGIDVIYGHGKFTRGRDLSPLPSTLTGTTNLVDIDADGFAVGFNLGTVYEINQNHRFGLSYRYSPTLEADGDITYIPNASQGKPFNLNNEKLKIPLPDIIEFSGFHQLTNKFALHYSIQWIGWDSFTRLETTGNTTIKEYQWQNGWHYAVGGTYSLNEKWVLRAGYMYDTSAQDQLTSISVPDSDRNWFSSGFSYHLNPRANIDFGITYLTGKDVNVTELSTGAPQLNATTHANAWLYGLQYSLTF
ncbi:outer membrane protein transport protein [Photobacterium kishitanii]|uniref:outer membrane protein transport protein n=1 Tax=Photobacterium kishitanii TaxID=318456 RepID=UPI000D17E240|nr:outer membrane protein transport protein [Photobacterium kishitanii]PSU22827.1 aromatic hydrocarbon degradation protein [Photobacterium kishitanii]